MTHREFQSVRDNLSESGLIFEKSHNLTDTLVEMDMVYPFENGGVTLDSIMGGTSKLIWKEMNRMAKKLSAKLSDKVHADDNEFAMHYSFKVTGKGKGEAVKYLPFTLEFDDGQVLTALVKNLQNFKSVKLNKEMMVTHFMLNKQDITDAIYLNGDTSIDTATTVMKLARVIEGFHAKFISKNPVKAGTHKEAIALREEIGAMDVDLSNVVGIDNEKPTVEELNKKAIKQILDFIVEKTDFQDTAYKEKFNDTAKLGSKKIIVKQDLSVDLYYKEKFVKNFNRAEDFIDSLKDDTAISKSVLEELNEGFDNPPKIVKTEAPTYTVNLPSGTEKYILIIREEFKKDEKLKGVTYAFVIDGVVMDAVDKKSVVIAGGEKAIQTHMKKIIHFITIGADKIEGKNVRMPSVDLIRNAEFVKEKTGLDYSIEHHQRATFLTAREDFQVGEDGRGYSLYRAIGKHAHESTKERWLMSDASRKYIIEKINEELAKDRVNPEEVGFVKSILNKPHTISEDGEVLTAEDGKRYQITEDYHGEEGITDLTLIENDVEITDENIAEHYPTMTSFQKNENQDALDSIISARAEHIAGELGFTDPKMWLLYVDYEKSEHDSNVIGQTVFGVKDNLHSLDRYIAEIKASDEYKTYIENISPKKDEPKPLSIKAKLKVIKPFMSKSQYKVISTGMDKEDYEFNDVIDRLHKTITTMPKTYEQDGKGDKAIAYLHYFNSGSDWYITEKDIGDEQVQAFGYAILNGDKEMAELGYISIEELTRLGVELDFHYSKQTIGEIKGEKEDDTTRFPSNALSDEEAEFLDDEKFAYSQGLKDTSTPHATGDKEVNELLNKYRHTDKQQKILSAYDKGHKETMEENENTEPTDQELEAKIKSNEVYKQVVKDSHGGVMYSVANIDKYDATEILSLWEKIQHKDSMDGIIRGAMSFLQDKDGMRKTTNERNKEHEEGSEDNFAINQFLEAVALEGYSDKFEKKLDEVVDLIEEKGLMDKYEDELNKLADQLTELMKSEN